MELQLADFIGQERSQNFSGNSVWLVYSVITTIAGRVLLVRRSGVKSWLLPGGVADDENKVDQEIERITLAQVGFRILINAQSKTISGERRLEMTESNKFVNARFVMRMARLHADHNQAELIGEQKIIRDLQSAQWVQPKNFDSTQMHQVLRGALDMLR